MGFCDLRAGVSVGPVGPLRGEGSVVAKGNLQPTSLRPGDGVLTPLC
jgi:hypothetical protein